MRDFFRHPAVVIIITLLVLIFIFSSKNPLFTYRTTSKSIRVLEQENEKIAKEILEAQVAQPAPQENEFAKEAAMRNELLLQKPGEVVVQLDVSPRPQPSVVPSPTPKPIEEWKKVFGF
ncbi:MAG: hypothetical protein H6774_00095 [Pseudomonadales bacterium]|nr:hypothetical protein [Candidatus Woesebacteria bacterium]MCB9801475.1 hypothetical protein [Pseudomonadales bacterium]